MIPHGYLVHHGIIGQKWGVRRYQNSDGSLTDAGKRRYSSDLYKEMNTRGDYRLDENITRQYANRNGIDQLSNNKELIESYKKFKNTSYDGPDEEYDPFTDPEIVKKAISEFEKDNKRKFDPNSKDERLLDYYIDDIADKTGAYEKAEKLNKAVNWDKAYDDYMSELHKVVDDFVGEYGDQKINSSYGEEKYRRAVERIVEQHLEDKWSQNKLK